MAWHASWTQAPSVSEAERHVRSITRAAEHALDPGTPLPESRRLSPTPPGSEEK